MATEQGWRVEPAEEIPFQSACLYVWVTKHVGISLMWRGHADTSGYKLIVKTAVSSPRYQRHAKRFREIAYIEEEDRRSILELVANFPGIEALIMKEELRRQEALSLLERQREALVARMERFSQKTGLSLWLKPCGPLEAIDEPFEADYERPPGWLQKFVLKPGSATFTIEVPDAGENVEHLLFLLQGLEQQCDKIVDKSR
jgi:hypothetical protein